MTAVMVDKIMLTTPLHFGRSLNEDRRFVLVRG